MSKVTFFELIFLLLIFFLFSFQTVAQNSDQSLKTSTATNSDKVLIVKVNPKKSRPITIISRNSTVLEITNELTRRLKTSFALSRGVKNYQPVINLSASTLENVLGKLAPFVIIENELAGQSLKPVIKGIYLFAHNEAVPAMADGTELSNKQSFIFEGNTETDFDQYAAPDSPLKIKYKDGKLSVLARQQLLIVTAGKIAEQLGTPLSVINNPKKVVNVEFSNLSLEKAFRQLPPNLILKYRSSIDGSAPLLTELILK